MAEHSSHKKHSGHHSSPPTEETKEYEDLLKVSASTIAGIQKQMQLWSDNTKHLGKNQKAYVEKLKEGIGELNDQKSINAKINSLNSIRNQLIKNQKVHQSSFNQQGIDNLKIITDALQLEYARKEAIEGVKNASEELATSLNSSLDGFIEELDHIPIIGSMLGKIASGPLEKVKESITDSAKVFTGKFAESINSGKGAMESLKIAGTGAFKSIVASVNPLTLALLGLGIALSLAFARFHQLESAADTFKEQTGLASADAHELEHTIGEVSNKMAYLGATASDVSKIMEDFTKEFDNMQIPLESTIESIVILNKNFGIATDTASEVNKVLQNMAGLSETQAQYLSNSVVEMSNLAGVAPQKVMKDISDSAEESYKYFKGDAKELAKAAVNAAKMGTSLTNIMKTSEKLLDFEQSVTDELEFSALAGKDINLGKARELAFLGDEIGMQQELSKQLSKIGDINKMSSYEKQKLMDLTGQDLKTLTNTQRIASKFGDLDKERLAAANSLLDKGLDINEIGEEELEKQAKRIKGQEQMQDMMDQIGNRMSAIGTEFMDIFAPIGMYLVKGILMGVKALSGTLIPAFQLLGTILKFAFKPIEWTIHIFQDIYDLIKAITKDGIGGFIEKAKEMGPLMAGIAVTVGIIATAWVASILPSVIATVSSIAVGLAGALLSVAGTLVGLVIDFGLMAIEAITTASALTLGIGALAIAGGIAVGVAAMNSGKNSAKSVNDGVIQDGQVVSTHPDDYLIATKDPKGLANSMNANSTTPPQGVAQAATTTPTISMDGVIAELKELKAAFMANKDVYMDGQLVTAKVSNHASNNPVTGR